VQHSTGGYLLHAALTTKWTFDLKADDVFWCTADIGWVTGHTYITYGPLALGGTEIVFEGVPTYPNAGRFWQMIEKHKVSIFYTAPTAIRSLIKAAETNDAVHPEASYDLSSLRILGSVGEPINPEAWMWYYKNVGGGRCPIVDTFWQTETGGHMITPLPGATPLVPGSCTLPFPGIRRPSSTRPATTCPTGRAASWSSRSRGRQHDPHHLGRPRALQEELLPRDSRATTWPATAPCATPRPATSRSPAASTTCSTCRATAWARWRSNRRWWPDRAGGRSRRGGPPRRH
jgi:acetyl-CoA synthetase